MSTFFFEHFHHFLQGTMDLKHKLTTSPQRHLTNSLQTCGHLTSFTSPNPPSSVEYRGGFGGLSTPPNVNLPGHGFWRRRGLTYIFRLPHREKIRRGQNSYIFWTFPMLKKPTSPHEKGGATYRVHLWIRFALGLCLRLLDVRQLPRRHFWAVGLHLNDQRTRCRTCQNCSGAMVDICRYYPLKSLNDMSWFWNIMEWLEYIIAFAHTLEYMFCLFGTINGSRHPIQTSTSSTKPVLNQVTGGAFFSCFALGFGLAFAFLSGRFSVILLMTRPQLNPLPTLNDY